MTKHPNTVTWGDYARAVENYKAEREKTRSLAVAVDNKNATILYLKDMCEFLTEALRELLEQGKQQTKRNGQIETELNERLRL